MLRDTELAGLARTLGNDTDLTITVGGDNSYCSADGNRINIARMPATPLGRMLMTGLVFHEVAHKRYTEGGRPQGMLGDLTNIIEDVRIEALTIKERPGTRYDLEVVTTYYAGKGDLTPTDTTTALLGLVLSYGYGEILQHRAVTELHATCRTLLAEALGSAFVPDVLRLLEQGFPTLTSTVEAQRLAERIIDRLKQVPQEEEPSVAQGDKKAEDRTDGSGEETTADASPDGQQQQSEPSIGNSTEDDAPSEDQQQKSNTTPDDCSGPDSAADKVPSTPTPKPTAQDIDRMINTGGRGYGDRSSALLNDLNQLAGQTPQELLHAVPLLPPTQRVTTPDRFADSLDETEAIATSARLRSRLLTLLQGKQRRSHAAGSSGRRIDSRRLVNMAFGDPRIFRKKEEVIALNTAVVILIDGSGSMLSTGGGTRTMSRIANASAFALHRTLYSLAGVSAASAVFAGKEGTNIRITADFGQKPTAPLFQVRPSGSTPTDQGLWYARGALLTRPESRRILLIITDGYPDDLDAAQAAAKRIHQDGIEIAAISIGTDAVQQLCDSCCVINQVTELPGVLFSMLERKVVQVV